MRAPGPSIVVEMNVREVHRVPLSVLHGGTRYASDPAATVRFVGRQWVTGRWPGTGVGFGASAGGASSSGGCGACPPPGGIGGEGFPKDCPQVAEATSMVCVPPTERCTAVTVRDPSAFSVCLFNTSVPTPGTLISVFAGGDTSRGTPPSSALAIDADPAPSEHWARTADAVSWAAFAGGCAERARVGPTVQGDSSRAAAEGRVAVRVRAQR